MSEFLPTEIPNLFDRFHRVPNTRSRTHEGSGIGLALVHELVKLHRGAMRIRDGAPSFWICIICRVTATCCMYY